jgi:hypothetical protein
MIRSVVDIGAWDLDFARDLALAVTGYNRRWVRRTSPPPLYGSRTRYQRDPPDEPWLSADLVLERGAGDCEDLSCWFAAEVLEMQADHLDHEDPWWTHRDRIIWDSARVVFIDHGALQYHAVVGIDLRDGRSMIEDPSMRLGMRGQVDPVVLRREGR